MLAASSPLPAVVERRSARRRFLLASVGALTTLAGCAAGRRVDPIPSGPAAVVPPMSRERRAALTPDHALDLLRAGNARFVAGQPARRDLYRAVKATADDAYPFAAILCCSEAQVVPEIVFDQSIGDLLIARVLGHVVGPDVVGSVEYASREAGARLVVVLGHESCGAVEVALGDIAQGRRTTLAAAYRPLLDALSPEGMPRGVAREHLPGQMMRSHVSATARALLQRSASLREQVARREVAVIGAILDPSSGQVSFDL